MQRLSKCQTLNKLICIMKLINKIRGVAFLYFVRGFNHVDFTKCIQYSYNSSLRFQIKAFKSKGDD